MSGLPRLHYHSDCDFFGGCENMLANFLTDPRVAAHYHVSFSYRWSDRYEQGLRRRAGDAVAVGERHPLLAGTLFTRFAAGLPKPLAFALRAANYLLLVRYWVLAWNAMVLYRAWRGRGIDVLHINNGGYPAALSCLSAAIAGRMAGIRNIVMVVNNIAQAGRYRYWWLDRPVDAIVGRCVDRFVTGSLYAGRALQAELGLPDERFVTLHNGIGARQPTETRAQSRTRLGITPDQLVFGMVALLEWRKGHRVLIAALAQLRDLVGEAAMPLFLIEGDGPDRAQLEELVSELAVGKWLRFVGVERHIFDFMQALDVMLLPSVANEDFPNVILEAMSLGMPVIASRLAGTPEQIEDGVTGALIAPGDTAALARALAAFIEARAGLGAMGARARARFDQHFTARAAVERYLLLYQSFLNRRII